MGILKGKKQLILEIFIDIFICIFTFIILFFSLNNETTQVSSSDTIGDSNIIIPNVTSENTIFEISDIKNKVESVNITAKTRLDGYNLYYYITFDTNISFNVNDTDYSLLNDTILIIDENCTIYFKYELNGYYSNDVYEVKISNIKISETTTEKVSEKELKESAVSKNEIAKESTSPYFIKVNYKANVVTIYTKDENGNYTVPYKAMVCSCGTYTPKSGTYKTTNKYAWRPLVHDVYGQYATRIVKKILFHSVPYSTNKKDALLYEEYDKLGTKASEGCVRLTVKDAKWIYDNCPSGTMVEFYSDSNPGPLGKPTAQKISAVEECRNWDPTDPASNNPWHTYKKEEEKPKEENITNNIINDISNNITNNVVNENINNSVVNNNITNDSSNLNNNITDNTIDNSTTNNSDITNNNVDNNIYNNTVNNSTSSENNIVENNMVTDNNTFNNDIVNNNSTTENNVTNNSTSSNEINNNSNENLDNNTDTNNNTNNSFTNSIFNNVI